RCAQQIAGRVIASLPPRALPSGLWQADPRMGGAQTARRRGLGRLAMRLTARWRSTAFCALSQNSGVVPRDAASFKAISAVTELRPLTIRLTTLTSYPRWSA